MKVESSTVSKLVITEVEGLDSVSVFLEDFGPGQGKVTMSCAGKSWTSFWGAMGDRKIAQFVTSCSADYIIGCVSPCLRSVQFSSDQLIKIAERCVIDRRRNRNGSEWNWMDEFDKREARSLFDQLHDLRGSTSMECWHHTELLSKLFGDEWWHRADDATEPNPDWYYLERIIDAVKEAIKQQAEVPA